MFAKDQETRIEPDDYSLVRRAIGFVAPHGRRPPSMREVAEHLGRSDAQFGDLFERWAGLTPEAFFQASAGERVRQLLRGSASALDAAADGDAFRPGRRRGPFVIHSALAPQRQRGAGLRLSYGFHPSPFGEAILVATSRGLAGLGFVDDGARAIALDDMQRRWPLATLAADEAETMPLAARAFNPEQWRPEAPLRLVLIGGEFERRVWEILLGVPMGRATTYSDIARRLGKPTAARAVGGAVARNPISFVVPCHRVLGRSGALTGYHWGLPRKQAMIGWEAGWTAGGV
jgi:AraC family transcriptional regulator of adaptative response/methylated-DNA-[protein]-cysteine methyltransferase